MTNSAWQDFATRWSHFPMGPKLRELIGLADDDRYQGEQTSELSTDMVRQFGDELTSALSKQSWTEAEQVSQLLDELVAMDLPKVALSLGEAAGDMVARDDFRTQLALGIAAMLEDQFELALDYLRQAQELLPSEPAPYVNITQIHLAMESIADATIWCEAGLDAEPNNYRLWELLVPCYQGAHGEYAGEAILDFARKRNAWAGISLGIDLTADGDPSRKARELEPIYAQGERDATFLIEFTAALGMASDFDRIPQIVWQAKSWQTEPLPWQLLLHAGQAELAQARKDEALSWLGEMEQRNDLPEDVKPVLADLQQEAQNLGVTTPMN